MFVYLGVYCILAFSAVGNYKRQHIGFFLCAGIFLIWFMGFRYETGCDYSGYFHRWVQFNTLTSFTDLLQVEEAGFALLMGSIKGAGFEYTWLNVAASALMVFCYIRFASAHPFGPLILTLLFPVIIVQLGMSGLRQGLAGGFLMLAFNAFMHGQRLRTAIWIIVGMQFHASVIIFLPIALLAGQQVNTTRLAVALAILAPVAGLMLSERFETYENRYIANVVTSGGASIRYALIFLPVPFFWLHQKKLQRVFPEVFPLLKLGALVILSLAPLNILSSIALHRLNHYIMPLSILLCVYVGAILFRKTSQGHWLAALAYGSYSFFWFLSSWHANICYTPYENTWFM
jgi:hypothetical protein